MVRAVLPTPPSPSTMSLYKGVESLRDIATILTNAEYETNVEDGERKERKGKRKKKEEGRKKASLETLREKKK